MKILVSGSSGTVGSHLRGVVSRDSSEIWRLVRSRTGGENLIFWDPEAGRIENPELLEGFDAVVHLSGESITGRWTGRKKRLIRRSRILSTRCLVNHFSRLARPPRTFICASATGYYGDRGEERLDESSAPGSGFLADTCREWEEEAAAASRLGTRVVNLRIGVVLSPRGGMLSYMLPFFSLGLGGAVGGGGQYMSWISIEDLSRITAFLLRREEISGPVNAVSPNPATNAEFARTLGEILGKPARLPVPAFAVRLLFGEMGRCTVLAGSRVFPEKLLSCGYGFVHEDLDSALRDVVQRKNVGNR